jgi:WD40 repeat protein
MVTKRGGKASVNVGAPTAMGAEVPEALQAVTLKAMATDRNKRYASVEAFAGDIERYQNGFATQAEDAGALKRLLLFIKRNKAVSSAAALFLVAVLAFTAKLAASEKTAREHERQAVAQTEKSRRAAADAQMSLAEAAEAVSDSGALKKALDAVPEDLRPTDWNYFQSRIDTATLTVDAPSRMTWIDVADFPSEPEAIVALRSDGELFKINLKTGAQQSLWRFNPPGVRGIGPMAVSGDGALLAIRYQQGNNDSVWVGSLNAGTPVSSFSEPANLNARAMVLLDDICMVRGATTLNAGVLKIELWNHRSGIKLWEMIGSNSAFSSDQKSVLVVSGSRQVQKRNLLTGEIQSSAVHPVGVHAWYLLNGMGTADWKTFFSNQGWSRALRSLDPWTGKVHFEIAPKHGNFVSVLMDPADSFLTLGKTSAQAGVMELRESSSGQLMRSLPFVQVTDGLEARRVLAKANAAVVRFPSAIKVWRLGKVAPLVDVRSGGSSIVRSGIPNRYMISTGSSVDLMEFSSENSKSRLISRSAVDGITGEGLVSDRSERRWVGYRIGGVAALGLNDSELNLIWGPKSIPYLGSHPRSVALHPDGELIWTGSSVLEWSSGSELVKVPDRKNLRSVFCAAWVGSDRVVEIVYSSQASSQEQPQNSAAGLVSLALWDAKRGELLTSVDAPNADWICVSPDGHQLAEAGSDKRVRIRNAHTLKVEQEFRVHEEGVTGIAWHPSQPLLVTSAKDGMIRVWNLSDLSLAEEWLTGVPSSMPRREMYWLQRIEIAPNGLELNVYRSGRLLVYRPQSFSTQK